MAIADPGVVMRRLLYALLIGALVGGCRTGREQQTSTIEGQIVVRPTGRTVVQPESVDVYAIPADTLEEYLARRKEEQKEDVDSAATQLAAQIDSIDAFMEPKWPPSSRDGDAEVATPQLLEAKIWGILRPGEPWYYFKKLPAAVDTSQTNENGEFEFEVPNKHDHYVVAKHIIGGGMHGEGYYHWIEKIDKSEKRIVLRDENDGYLYRKGYATIDTGARKFLTSQIIQVALKESMHMQVGDTPSGDWKKILRLAVLAPDTLSTEYK